MRYRSVGATDLIVSEAAFGCGDNAGLMLRGHFREQARVIARALELGVTFFDVSPAYGSGAAERNLGRALKDLGARPFINSKAVVDVRDRDAVADYLVRSVEESLRRLRIDALDMLQIDIGPSLEASACEAPGDQRRWAEDFLRPDGVCEGLERLRRAGKIRHAGFICRGDDVEAACALLDTGLFHLINVSYSLLNPTAGMMKPAAVNARDFSDVIGEARKRGASAAVYSPLAGGFLTDDFLHGAARHPLARAADPLAVLRASRQVAALSFLREDEDSLAIAAWRFVLSHPGVATVIGGFSSLEQLEELATAPARGPLSGETMARIETLWASGFGAPLP